MNKRAQAVCDVIFNQSERKMGGEGQGQFSTSFPFFILSYLRRQLCLTLARLSARGLVLANPLALSLKRGPQRTCMTANYIKPGKYIQNKQSSRDLVVNSPLLKKNDFVIKSPVVSRVLKAARAFSCLKTDRFVMAASKKCPGLKKRRRESV